jgi:predicted phage tail component-like protein
MVLFNGVSLEDVAPVIIGNVFIPLPPIRSEWQDKPVSSGSRFVRKKYDKREIKIEFCLPVVDADERADYINAIARWANSDAPLALELSKRPGKYIMATVSKLHSPSTGEWWEKLSIEFTACDPFFIDLSESAVACGLPFQVNGDDPASGYILNTNTTSVVDPEWTLDADQSVALDGTIAAGTIKVDLDKKTVTLDDVSQMANLTLQSRFFELTPGLHTITGDGRLLYMQRWL